MSKVVGCNTKAESEGCRAEAPRRRAYTMQFFYVYILHSQSDAEHFYVGRTQDLHARLKKHNAGEVPHSAKFRPWKIKTAIAFNESKRAVEFERYLKSASGRAFAKKRL